MRIPNLPIAIAAGVLLLAGVACGGSATPTGPTPAPTVPRATVEALVTRLASETQPTPSTAAPANANFYDAGQVVRVKDHTIVLNKVTVQDGLLKANFTIDNTGSQEVLVSSMLSFSARDSEGSKLEQDIIDCGSASLDGKVLPADKLKGDICWKAPAGDRFKIYYEASLFGSGAIVWEVTTIPTLPLTRSPTPVAAGPRANTAANLRAGPGVAYPIIGSATAGQPLVIVGRTPASDWYQLAGGAWIFASLVDGAPAVPVAPAIPALPAGGPTARPLPSAASSTCDCDHGDTLNCDDFAAWDAQACYLRCKQLTGRDVHGLDRDNDGDACEWQY